MSSNYWAVEETETVPKTVKCNVCHGSGVVGIDGHESDCVACEGWGDIEVP